MALKKITVKDLASEVEKLIEENNKKDNLIKALDEKVTMLTTWAQKNFSSICDKITENEQNHFKNEKILEQKLSDLNLKLVEVKSKQEEESEEPLYILNTNFKCKQCSSSFGNRVSLKKHILTNHPRNFDCNFCDETFNQIWKLEQHMKTHSVEKIFKCNTCDKRFVLQWRLEKHIKGHTNQNVKFCHYFNNDMNCIYEETSGCMFRHEAAPACKNLNNCKYKKCQFSHNDDEEVENDTEKNFSEGSQNEEVVEETSHIDNENEKCAFCNEIVDHSKHHIRTCTNCDFTTKCWAADNKHWNETPEHNFSTAELRDMGYSI